MTTPNSVTRDTVVAFGKIDVNVGRYTYGLAGLSVKSWSDTAKLSIGRYCSIAGRVRIFMGGNHRADWITTYPFGHINQGALGGDGIKGHPQPAKGVCIGNDVWIGEGASIMDGVTLGNGVVVAANSHVVKDVAPYTIVGGNPAQVIRRRFDDAVIEKLQQLAWWDMPDDFVRANAPYLCMAPTAQLLDELLAKKAGYKPGTLPPVQQTWWQRIRALAE